MMKHIVWAGLMLMSIACGGSSSSPGAASAAIAVTAVPNPIAGRACGGCGAQTITDREAVARLTIQETGGVAATVTGVGVALRENGTNVLIASGEFDATAIANFAGSNRIAAGGSIAVPDVGVHYVIQQAGKAATLTYTVRIRDDNGNALTRDLAVAVSPT